MLRRDVSPTNVSSMNRRREISVHEIDFCSVTFRLRQPWRGSLNLKRPG